LYDLAAVCSVGPPQVSELTVTDFAQLLAGLNAQRAAAQQRGG
jgi:hypothetical protein